MNSHVLNACLLVGWIMATAGGCMWNIAAGIGGGGLLLLIMTVCLAKFAGVYIPSSN